MVLLEVLSVRKDPEPRAGLRIRLKAAESPDSTRSWGPGSVALWSVKNGVRV